MTKAFDAPPHHASGEEESTGTSPLRDILAQRATRPVPDPAPATLVGRLTRLRPDGVAEVTYAWPEGQPHTRRARQTLPLDAGMIGRECVLAFDGGDITRPIVIGLLQAARPTGGPLVIQAEAGIVIQSGAARITLGADGEINIQGMYINSQAYGPHRIKGGSVKIN